MLRVVALLTVVLVLLSVTPIANAETNVVLYEVFASKNYGIKPLGVFRNYVIGFDVTHLGTEIKAICMLSNNEVSLGVAEGFGLNPEKVIFWKTANYFMLTDGKAIVIWDKDLRQVGRYAQDSIRGAVILPSGHLVVWSKEVVSVFTGPKFVYGSQYDVWGAVYNFLASLKLHPEEFLELAGYDVSEIVGEVILELHNVVEEANGTITEGPNVVLMYDLEAVTPTEAREKLSVDVVTASYVSGTLFVASNMRVRVVVEGEVSYEVTEDNKTITEKYSTVRTYEPLLGALLKVNPVSKEVSVEKVFYEVVAGASSTVMAFAYEPLLEESKAPYELLIILEDGSYITVPIYTTDKIKEVYLVSFFELVKTGEDILFIYRRGKFVGAFLARAIKDIGVDPKGRVYIVYKNYVSVLELGLIDQYSGRYEKYVVETDVDAVGAYIFSDLLFLAGEKGGSTRVDVATRSPLASVTVWFMDPYGSYIYFILNGYAEVSYGSLRYGVEFITNPLIMLVPPGATINISVLVPYGKGVFTYYIAEAGSYSFEATISVALTPGIQISSLGKPFYNPFFREHAVIRDVEILKYELPGAISIDAYGPLLALIEAPKQNVIPARSVISVYRIDGTKIYSVTVPKAVTEIKFFYPYIAVKGSGRLFILDALTGVIKGVLSLDMTGYAIDSLQSYAVAWSPSKIAVLDIRKQVITYLDMNVYGTVLVAPIINGIIYAYVRTQNNITNIYVINPATRSVIDILPWDGTKIISFASDGVFHAVSYEGGTDILSLGNGFVRIKDMPVMWIRTLGRHVNIPNYAELQGNIFSAVVMKKLNKAVVYVVGLNAVQVHEIHEVVGDIKLSVSYLAEAVVLPNATSAVVLKDYTGVPRITLVTSITPSLLAISENLVAYGNNEVVYLVPNPKILGKYRITLRIYDDQGNPLNATLYLKEFNIQLKAENGIFKTYLSLPGKYHFTVLAPHFKEKEVVVAVSDQSPVAEFDVWLEPKLYELVITVVTPEGKLVKDGTITIKGIDIAYEEEIDLLKEVPAVAVRKGTYEVTFTSEIFARSKTTVAVYDDTELTLLTNRTGVRVEIHVTDEVGTPLAGAEVVIESPVFEPPLKFVTNETGVLRVVLPYGIEANVTATYPGYETAFKSINATEAIEEKPVELVLRKIVALLTVLAQDEEGNPEVAYVVIYDAEGNMVTSQTVIKMATFDLDLGAYTVEGTTEDGRRATTSVILTPENPIATVTLMFPKKPEPLYIKIFPYLLIAVIAISIITVIIRKFFKKPKPKKVT